MPEINCDPDELTKAAKCYCFSERQSLAVIIYLLAQKVGDASTPAELARKAACYCSDKRTAEAIITYLLCQLE